jgi:hypothetical protein
MDKTEAGRRMFRRFRARLKAELGITNPSVAEMGLLNQAALLALRERQLREQILAGEIGKNTDVDLIRLANALRRVRAELRESAAAKSDAKRDMSLAEYLAEGNTEC